jgi:hypothetical protein
MPTATTYTHVTRQMSTFVKNLWPDKNMCEEIVICCPEHKFDLSRYNFNVSFCVYATTEMYRGLIETTVLS